MQCDNKLAVGGVFDNGANIGIVFANGGREISPVNFRESCILRGGRQEDMVEVRRYL
jgi:hypothetical protein